VAIVDSVYRRGLFLLPWPDGYPGLLSFVSPFSNSLHPDCNHVLFEARFQRAGLYTFCFQASAPSELKQKGIWLKKVVKENYYYQDPELSLVSLAGKLGLTTHELSRIINTVLKKSFNDFINEFRVAEVIRKLQNPVYDRLTLLGIAFDSGFNSQSSFHRIFKQITGKSPLAYKNQSRLAELKKEQGL
jgi:AraC-like DNA-binding protein